MSYVYRYNPDSSSRRAVRVRSDSPEAAEWPTRAPSAAVQRAKKELIQSGARIGQVAIPAAIGVAVKGGRVAAGAVRTAATAAKAALGAAATVSTGTVALVAGAFAVGYAIGTGLVKLWEYIQPEERAYRQALAFRKAREDWKRQHGREMTASEVQAMGKGFKQATASVRAQIGSQRG